MRCLFGKVSCIYLKEQNFVFYLHQNALNGQELREEFPCKQWYQNPSQYYYKLLAVKVVWVDALLAYLLKNSLLTPPPTKNISNPHF